MDEIAKIVRDSRKRMRELAEEFASRCDLKGQNGHTALLNLWHETQDIYLRASSIVGDASELKRTMIAGDRDASSADSECNILYGMYNDLWNRWKDADDASRHALGRED